MRKSGKTALLQLARMDQAEIGRRSVKEPKGNSIGGAMWSQPKRRMSSDYCESCLDAPSERSERLRLGENEGEGNACSRA